MGLQTEFTGGELTPSLYAKPNAPIFAKGLKTCRNMMVMPTGGATNRPGTTFAGEVKDSSKKVRLESFEFSTSDTRVMEFGDKYIRFLSDGLHVADRYPVSGITNASPAVVSSPDHAIANGDRVRLDGEMTGALGSEMLTNGDFAADITSWIDGGSSVTSWDAGRMKVEEIGRYQDITVTEGTEYLIEAEGAGTYSENQPGSAVLMVYFQPTAGGNWIKLGEDRVPVNDGNTYPLSLALTAAANGTFRINLLHHHPGEWLYTGYSHFDNATCKPITGVVEAPLDGEIFVATNVVAGVSLELYHQDATPVDTSALGPFEGAPTILNLDSPYEVVSPYAEEHLFELHFQQSADVVTIVHPEYQVHELIRYGSSDWSILPLQWGDNTIAAPANFTAVRNPSGTTKDRQYRYCVTAVDHLGRESLPSTIVDVDVFDLWDGNEYIDCAWDAVDGAEYYNVYTAKYGLFGKIGETLSLTFSDDNIAPDYDQGGIPLEREITPENVDEHPSTLAIHNLRMMYASSVKAPYRIWGTQPTDTHDLRNHRPIADDSVIDWYLASNRIDEVRHLVSWRKQLLIFTAGGLWVAEGSQGVITPLDYTLNPNLGIGCSSVPPQMISDNALFLGVHGDIAYDMTYSQDAEGYVEVDRSIHASHLFKNRKIVQWAYQRRPYSIVWAVTDTGELLALTYSPSSSEGAGIWAWHRHDTQGEYESVCVVKEDSEDVPYFTVKRTINSVTRRYVERMAHRDFDSLYSDGIFMDSVVSANFEGTPVDDPLFPDRTITGLDHLEGEEVSIVADGQVVPPGTVTGGALTIQGDAEFIHVGLSYVCDLEPLNFMGDATSKGFASTQGSMKKPISISLYVERSRGFQVGPDEDNLYSTKRLLGQDELYTGEVKMNIPGSWRRDSTILIRHINPLPLTVLSVAPVVSVGS